MKTLRASFLLAAVALAGCASQSTSDISVTDRSVFIPSGRIGIDISPRVDAPSRPHTGHGIELGASGGSGDDRQSLAAGENPIVFAGRSFTAPEDFRHEFDFRFAEIAYRYRHFFGNGQFGIEGLGGLGFAQLDLTLATATQRASEKLDNTGLVGGFGIVWKFLPSTSLQSRITFFLSGKNEGLTDAGRFELYVAQAIGRHAALRAGFAAWSVRSEREENDNIFSDNSPIRVRFSGPALGLDLAF
jgi:hypothetical protein